MCVAPDNFNNPFISVIAHSYGTTTVGEARKVAETNVNNAVLYGSAGIGVDSVTDSNWGDGWKVDRDQKGKQQNDLVDGKVPADLMEKIKSSQNIAQSDLINVESK